MFPSEENNEENECLSKKENNFIDFYDKNKRDTYFAKDYGKRTLNENMADYYGLKGAFNGWVESESNNNNNMVLNEKIKYYIMSYLKLWCKDSTYIYNDNDKHGTLFNRAILPLKGLKNYYETSFNCSLLNN